MSLTPIHIPGYENPVESQIPKHSSSPVRVHGALYLLLGDF